MEKLFSEFERASEDGEKGELVEQICTELIVHSKLEEEIFYPECRNKEVEDDLLDEAQVEHDGAKILISDLLNCDPGDEFYDAKVKVLSEYIKHHVGEEEKADGIFAKARKAGLDMSALGSRLSSRKQQLLADPAALLAMPPAPRSLHPQLEQNSQEDRMARQYDRDRDDRGRFMNEDDDRGGRSSRSSQYGSGSQGRDRDDHGRFMSDDDNGYGRGGNGNRGSSRDRDEQGRYMSDDEDYGRRYGRDGDDNRGGNQRGRGSQSRGGYEDDNYGQYGRGGSQRSERDDQGRFMSDEDGYSQGGSGGRGSQGRSRYEDDDRSSGRSSGGRSMSGGLARDDQGRFMSDEDDYGQGRGGNRGSSQSRGGSQSRGRNEDDERSSGRGGNRGGSQGGGEGRGWYGDSEGHSQAAERGWEHRSGGMQSGRGSQMGGSSSRRSNDDDDRGSRGGNRGRGGQSHGGWFGDSEGHSEAARRGWQSRD